MNALEKIVDLLAAITVMFLVPLLYYGSGKCVSQAMLSGQAGENFLARISTAGEITLPVLEELEHALLSCGCSRFDVQRQRRLFEPSTVEGDVIERIYTEEKEKMLERIHREGRLRLQKGDLVRLIVYVNDIPTMYSGCIRTGAAEE